MVSKRIVSWVVAALMIVVPLVFSDVSTASESGCHKGGGQPVVDAPPRR